MTDNNEIEQLAVKLGMDTYYNLCRKIQETITDISDTERNHIVGIVMGTAVLRYATDLDDDTRYLFKQSFDEMFKKLLVKVTN